MSHSHNLINAIKLSNIAVELAEEIDKIHLLKVGMWFYD